MIVLKADGKMERKDSYKNLSDIQREVGGYAELYRPNRFYRNGIDVWCNEEGKLLGLDTSCYVIKEGKVIEKLNGNIVFTGRDNKGATIALTEEQIDFIFDEFRLGTFQINEKIVDKPYFHF